MGQTSARQPRANGGAICAGLAAIAAILTGLSGQASAQQVQNGSFTLNNGSLSSSYVPTTSNLTDWTVSTSNTNPDPCVVYANSFSACGFGALGPSIATLGTDPGGTPYFGAGGWSGTNPILSQTITGLSSGKYIVSFYQAAVEDSPVANNGVTWTVSFGGSSQNSTAMNIPASSGGSGVGWEAASLIFTVTGPSQALTFLANGGTNSAPPLALLDGITIAQVPEPASIALLGLGALGLAGMRRRRTRLAV